jgi:hypothetical protein
VLKRRFLPWLVGLAGLSLLDQPSRACSCFSISADTSPVDWPSLLQPEEIDGIIFQGTVIEVRETTVGKGTKDDWAWPATKVTFRVTKAWSGAVGGEFVLHQASSTCAMWFESGTEYVVFAEDAMQRFFEHVQVDIPIYIAHACGRTIEAKGSENFIARLDELAKAKSDANK